MKKKEKKYKMLAVGEKTHEKIRKEAFKRKISVEKLINMLWEDAIRYSESRQLDIF